MRDTSMKPRTHDQYANQQSEGYGRSTKPPATDPAREIAVLMGRRLNAAGSDPYMDLTDPRDRGVIEHWCREQNVWIVYEPRWHNGSPSKGYRVELHHGMNKVSRHIGFTEYSKALLRAVELASEMAK